MKIAGKTTFILNNEYKEQVDMLNDAQAGQLFRAILQYANDNTVDNIADPVVSMVFSFVRQQMDKDYKKYEETCKKRSEAGRKAGKASAEKRAMKKQAEANSTIVNDDQPFQHDCECECDLDLEQQPRQEEDEDAHAIFPFGKNKIPTTNAELDKYRKNDIQTAEEAQEYEYRRNRGEVI